MREKTYSNVKVPDIDKVFGGDEYKTIVEKAILETKKVIYTNRERERPFSISAVKRVLYRQQCLEEYKAEIENNVQSVMQTWVYVYDELQNSYN